MEVQVGEIHLEHIKDMDITTIFGNLLDNALEAAEQADRKRVIQLGRICFMNLRWCGYAIP